MYDTAHYAASRLNGTIVRYKSKAVRVDDVENRGDIIVATCEVLETGRRATVKLKDLNLKTPPLGFVNTRHGLCHIQRQPKRNDWRQGIRNNNCVATFGHNLRHLSGEEIQKLIAGDFPGVKEASRLDYEGERTAFHRDWAFIQGAVHYKGRRRVGKHDGKGNVQLDDKFQYLKECLEEVLNGKR